MYNIYIYIYIYIYICILLVEIYARLDQNLFPHGDI